MQVGEVRMAFFENGQVLESYLCKCDSTVQLRWNEDIHGIECYHSQTKFWRYTISKLEIGVRAPEESAEHMVKNMNSRLKFEVSGFCGLVPR